MKAKIKCRINGIGVKHFSVVPDEEYKPILAKFLQAHSIEPIEIILIGGKDRTKKGEKEE